MTTERITLDIKADVEKMGKFLEAISADRSSYIKFLENPTEALQQGGIDLKKYGSKSVTQEHIVNELTGMVNDIVAANMSHMVLGLVARTAPEQSTNTWRTTHFDHHIGSESFTNSQTNRGIDAGFEGIDKSYMLKVQEMLQGPLISLEAVTAIQTHMQATLTHAQQQVGIS